MAGYKERVYGARIIVMSFVATFRHKVYGARLIVMSFAWQLTGTEFMVQG
jgi:hypothetical protein